MLAGLWSGGVALGSMFAGLEQLVTVAIESTLTNEATKAGEPSQVVAAQVDDAAPAAGASATEGDVEESPAPALVTSHIHPWVQTGAIAEAEAAAGSAAAAEAEEAAEPAATAEVEEAAEPAATAEVEEAAESAATAEAEAEVEAEEAMEVRQSAAARRRRRQSRDCRRSSDAIRHKEMYEREAWETRALNFLAAGDARCADGTPVSRWIKLQNALSAAKLYGKPLDEECELPPVPHLTGAGLLSPTRQLGSRPIVSRLTVRVARACVLWQRACDVPWHIRPGDPCSDARGQAGRGGGASAN